MKLRDKLLISLGFIILMGFGLINFFSIKELKGHHAEKYDKYTYAYDCIKEAEITYWNYKCALVNEVQTYINTIALYFFASFLLKELSQSLTIIEPRSTPTVTQLKILSSG